MSSVPPLDCDFSAAALSDTTPLCKVGKIKDSRNLYTVLILSIDNKDINR